MILWVRLLERRTRRVEKGGPEQQRSEGKEKG